MSFLHRRRSMGPSHQPHAHDTPLPSMPFPAAVENLCIVQSTSANAVDKTSSSSGMFRRVSTLLTGRRKRQPVNTATVTPLDIQPPEPRWRVINDEASPTVSEFSIDDIRRPSGLGRAISFSSKRSLPPSPFTAGEDSPFHKSDQNGTERTRTVSSPNLSRAKGARKRTKSLTRSPSITQTRKNHLDRSKPAPQLPREILIVVYSFLPRHVIVMLATISRVFCAATRIALYEVLDMRTLQPKQAEQLVTLLAYRHDLTDLIRTFECHIWPIFFPPQSNFTCGHIDSNSFSPSLTATFTIAFQNMNRITSLVLPSFDYTFLRHHSAFGLQKLTFLSYTMTPSELTQLFIWLNGQTNITHLEFPNLMDTNDIPTNTSLTDLPQSGQRLNNTLKDSLNTRDTPSPNYTPSTSPIYPFNSLPPSTPKTPFNSPALLPALTTLVATPFIINSLITTNLTVLSRPLKSVAVNINTTLYSGLRPAALLNPLHGITNLNLKFGPSVDKRTIGKMLSAAATLSLPLATEGDITNVLRVLEIELAVYTPDADLALYKMIASSLPRYQGLVELSIQFTPDACSESTPSLQPTLSDHDITQISMWTKHCPSLESICLLSGARWKRAK